jgi:aryl-alcohol dehydrogenase-like predicted oxidoreductase
MSWLKERVLSEQDKTEKVKQLKGLADELAIPLPHLAIGWCLKNPNVSTVILGASKVEQLTQNLACWDSLPKLTEDVLLKVEDILQNKPTLITF